jgi:hypothetical protein
VANAVGVGAIIEEYAPIFGFQELWAPFCQTGRELENLSAAGRIGNPARVGTVACPAAVQN